jgi:S1-C subfamily serine protease
MTNLSHTLQALSHNLADTVEKAGSAIVAINARTRMPASGIHWHQGIIITSDENLRRSEEISITLADRSTVPVTLLGRDASTDVAVFRIQNADLPVATIGDATSLKVGHLVLALARGSEGDLRAAMGAVSVITGAWRSMSGGNIDQFIRPDLTIYPGFAGGALVDTTGAVVGMNTTGRRGIALTIPATTINRVVNQLVDKGRITRGYLGLGMQPVRLPETLTHSLKLSSAGGVIVVNVEPKGPADKAGVLLGDVLVTVDGTTVTDTNDVQALLASSEMVGKTIPVKLIRGGTLLEVPVTIGEKPVRN